MTCRPPVCRRTLETLGEAPSTVAEVGGQHPLLPASVGWTTLLKLWKGYNVAVPIRDGGRELLRVEVLEARAGGTAKFRLWYYRWQETRPHQPYVVVEITYKGENSA